MSKVSYTINSIDGKYHEVVTVDGHIVTTWNDEASWDYPEDLVMRRDIGSLIAKVFKAGQDYQRRNPSE